MWMVKVCYPVKLGDKMSPNLIPKAHLLLDLIIKSFFKIL